MKTATMTIFSTPWDNKAVNMMAYLFHKTACYDDNHIITAGV